MLHNANTENRNKNPLRGIREYLKKALVYLMCVSMLISNMSTSIAYAATRISADEDESEIYSMDIDSIMEAVADAVENGEPVGEDEYEFSGSAAYKYNRILNTDDGSLYEIYPDLDEEGSIELRTFVRLSEDPVDDLYNVTGDEDIIFLFINDGTDDVEARVHIFNEDDIYETKVINIPAMFSSVTLVNADDDDEEVVEVALKTADEKESAEGDKEESDEENKEEADENDEETSGSLLEFVTIDTKQSNIETAALKAESASDADPEVGPGADPDEDDTENEAATEEDSETAEQSGETGEGTLKRATSSLVSASTASSVTSSTVTVETVVETPSNVIIGTTYTEGTKALAGTIYEAVGLEDASAVAFTTTFKKMGYEAETVTYEAEDGGIAVTVTAPKNALPEDANLVVERYDEESEDYEVAALAIKYEETVTEFSLLHAISNEEDTDEDEADEAAEPEINMAALDIHFEVDGEKIEPDGTVKVSIDISELIPEDAVLDSLEVQHLVEEGDDIENIVVADETAKTEGTVDLDAAVAEFEVESFSDFTVTWEWSGQTGTASSVSITVTAYLDDQELDGLANIEFDSEDDELNLETMLNDEDYGTSDYTFSWAYFTYESTTGPSTQTTTIGSSGDPVVAIEKAAGGQSSLYVIQLSGTSNTVRSGNNMHLYAYYITPTFSVEITSVAEDEAEDWLLQATLSHAGEYESVKYVWSITSTDGNETSLAEVDWSDETGRAFIVWSEGVQNFDEVIVHVTVTITREDGTTESASTEYILEYGDEYVNIQMTYGPNNTALGADVTVTLINTVTGKTYTPTTDANGQILSLEIEPGIYIVTANTTINGSNYSCSETVAMHDASANSGNYTINLNYADADRTTTGLDPAYPDDSENIIDNWNHVDIKLSTGSSDSGVSSEGVTVNIIGAVITGSDGSIKYTANETSIAAGASDNEWQIYFYTGTDTSGSYSHTISFSTTDSITIIYTLEWEDSGEPETYTVTINGESTYDSGTTYPANGQRAYKLYNYLYGTSYTSNAQLMAAGVDSIDIGGMSMMLVAGILCDSSVTGTEAGEVTGTSGMWGMDFALSVEGFVSLSTAWMFDVEKTYENHAMTAGMFTFTLDDAIVDENGIWTEEEGVGSGWEYTWSNSAAGKNIDGNSSDTMSGIYIPYDDDEIQKGVTYYYILSESKGDNVYTVYDETVFGAKVYVHIDDVTTSETYGEAIVEVTYYTLTAIGEDDKYTATEYSGEKITLGDNNYPTFHFTNIYTTDIKITKTDPYGNDLKAQFTLTQVVTDPDTEETRNCYYDPNNENGPWIDYTDASTIVSFELGTIELDTPYEGTYTLTEITPAEGYGTLPAAIEFTVNEEKQIVEGSVKWANDNTEGNIFDYATLEGGLILTIMDPDTTTEVTVTKVWEDSNNQDGKRPESISVQLTADEEANGDAVTLNDDNEWTYTWSDLPVHNRDGEEIKYSVDEPTVPDGYASIVGTLIANEDATAYTITVTNTYTTEKVTVEGSKTWDDAENQDGKRPTSITINLLANGEVVDSKTVTADNNWSWSFTDLDKYAGGVEITYTITENEVDGYTSEVNSYDVTNSHTPEMIDIEGNKTWEDNNNQDGKRPSSITINLLADGEVVNSKTVTADDNWSWSFTDLPKYSDGVEIAYTITEDAVTGYETSINGYDVTNSYTPETLDIKGTKTWDDADNQDGKRPSSITINLLADGKSVDSKTVTAVDNWSWSFTDLPKYSDGVEITYTITEDTVADYETNIDGYDVTNTHTTETVDIEGSKTWDDANNQDGKRPTSITINLLSNGEVIESKTVTATDDWSWSFTDLPKYSNGVEITYTISEEAVAGYETTVDGYDVTNSYTPETVNVEGSKTWDDNNDQDGGRPESITIHLYADGTEIDSVTVTADDEWAWSFKDLDKYRDGGVDIVYTVTEDEITTGDYSPTINGYDITNTHTPDKTSLHVQKFWRDDNDQDGLRPEEITVTLTADGEETDQTLTLNGENSWSGNFTDLDKYESGGTEIEYSVSENIEGYDYVPYVTDIEGTTTVYIFNEHISATTEISGSKIWDDSDDQDGIRPKSITVRLQADGEAALDENSDPITATVTVEDDWTFTFTDLPKYHDHGVEIVYTVIEDSIEGYETAVESDSDAHKITNTHTPETIEISVSKVWDDDDEYNHRPESVEVELVVNGEETDKKITLSEANDWADTFTNLDKYSNGEEIVYTVKEITPEALQYYTPKTTYNEDGSVTILNQREYFPIDEEIVVDESDRESWVKNESVNEYNAIELEMSTYLPVIEVEELLNGEFTMNFHEVLDSELNLDELDGDFTIYIGGEKISHEYYTITLANSTNPLSLRMYSISPVDDGCTFHVDVDLTALYTDGIIDETDLLGDTEIMIFFYADLEGTGLNGSYKSTVWYDVYDGDEWQYTSNIDVVEVYTYEIEIQKYDASKLEGNDYAAAALSGATLGVYYDEDCTDPVSRNSEPYTTVSGEDGMAIFYGLADGAYYVKETAAPSGYVLSDEVLTVTLGEELNNSGYVYKGQFANTPEESGPEPDPEPEPEPNPEPDPEPIPEPDGGDGGNGGSGGGGGGSTYSGSGSGHSNSSTSGPGAESTAHESSGGGSSSDHSGVNTDSIGGLPQTGEGNTMMILIGVCVALAAVLAVLFYMRRKTPKDQT